MRALDLRLGRFPIYASALLMIGVAGCEQTKPPTVAAQGSALEAEERREQAARDAQDEEDRRVLAERAAELASYDAKVAQRKTAVELRSQESPRLPPEYSEAEKARVAKCSSEREQRKKLLAELEPKIEALRAEREEAKQMRPQDETWVRANCRWENAPHYVHEVERVRGSGDEAEDYEVNERFAGISRSIPKCPRGTSPRRLMIASDIANQMMHPGSGGIASGYARQQEDKAAGVPEYKAAAADDEWCNAHPDVDAPSEQPASSEKLPPDQAIGF